MNSRSFSADQPAYAVCATNYNCAHALEAHLESIYAMLGGVAFEYAVVDNHSRDGSQTILEDWSKARKNFRYRTISCTMGTGRNLAVRMTRAPVLVVVDTDVIYRPSARRFVEFCSERYPTFGVQGIFLGVYPRSIWDLVGGRRSLNTYEDVDFWMRLHAMRLIRWCPVSMGHNLKDAKEEGGLDFLSHRYNKAERLTRLLRREWDLWKTRQYTGLDLSSIIAANQVEFEGGSRTANWTSPRPRTRVAQRIRVFGRLCKQALQAR